MLTPPPMRRCLNKLPRSTDATLTQINLDTQLLNAILSTPLFLWLYYLLGEVFKGVDVSLPCLLTFLMALYTKQAIV